MRELMRRARIAALSDLPILILGETGTGKEEIARRVYAWSAQAQGPWIAVNAALAAGNLVDSEMFGHRKGAFTGAESNRQGAIQSAHRGMLFLDELGDLPIDTQAKLLRVLETGEVKPLGGDTYERSDFRLVAATSRKLEESVEKGLFRLDLFHRVSGFVLRIPPLRERNEEIFPLAEFIACHQAGIDISHSCESILKAHAWPGNVRELRATILRGAALAKAEDRTIIETTDLEILQPAIAPRHRESPPATLEAWEAIHVREALTRTGGSRAQAALELGIARSTLFEKIKKHGLGRPEC
jgi:DNA-binding NtrC family response regulator